MMNIKNYINGAFLPPVADRYIDNYNPSNGEIYGQIPNSDVQDVELAYKSAKKAFPSWSKTTIDERSRILIKISELLEANLQRFAEAESKDNGKPISLAKSVDIPRAASNFRFFGNAITQFASESHESVGQNAINYTLRQPIGVVGCISPWNLPLYLFTWKIAPAIAAGNCVVAKPSEVTSLSLSLSLSSLFSLTSLSFLSLLFLFSLFSFSLSPLSLYSIFISLSLSIIYNIYISHPHT